jgi:hypothetical protein
MLGVGIRDVLGVGCRFWKKTGEEGGRFCKNEDGERRKRTALCCRQTSEPKARWPTKGGGSQVRDNKQITQPDGSALTLGLLKKRPNTRLTRLSQIKAGNLLGCLSSPVLSGRPDRVGWGSNATWQPPRPKPAKPDWGGGSNRNRSPMASRWRMRCLWYAVASLSCHPCSSRCSFAVSLAVMSANLATSSWTTGLCSQNPPVTAELMPPMRWIWVCMGGAPAHRRIPPRRWRPRLRPSPSLPLLRGAPSM